MTASVNLGSGIGLLMKSLDPNGFLRAVGGINRDDNQLETQLHEQFRSEASELLFRPPC